MPSPSARLAASLTLSLLAAAGCASSNIPSTLPTTQRTTVVDETSANTGTTTIISRDLSVVDTLSAAPAAAFEQVRKAYEALGLSPNTIVPPTGIVGVTHVTLRRALQGVSLSRYLDCGTEDMGAARASSDRIDLTMLSQLAPAGSGTAVRTSLTATAVPTTGASTDPIACSTRGALERKLKALLNP